MVIDKVYGLHATNISMNDRFTMLMKLVPERQRAPMRPRRRPNAGFFIPNFNFRSRTFIDQLIARRLQMEAKRLAVKQRLGMHRRSSEGNLPGLRRSNSFGNLSQNSAQSRKWRQSNGFLNGAASFSNLSAGTWRGFRRRGGQRVARGRSRGAGGARVGSAARSQRARGGGQARGRPRGRGRGQRGGAQRNQPEKPEVTKEQLDLQLDQYMAGSKSALDAEIDEYMKNAMDS